MTEVLNPVGLDPKSVIHFLSELREKTVLALASSKTRKKKFVDKFIAQGKNMFFFYYGQWEATFKSKMSKNSPKSSANFTSKMLLVS